MEKTLTDNGNATVTADSSDGADSRHIANAKALAIVNAVMKAESALALTAKEHGKAVFVTVYQDKSATLDTVIAENKLAAGFKALGDSEAGRKAKGRLNVYFSNFRFIAERWEKLSDEQRAAILNGDTSVHYLAATIRDEERKAEREAAKAAKEAEGDTVADAPSLADAAKALLEAYKLANAADRNAAYDTLVELFDIVDEHTKAENETNVAAIAA